MNTPSTLIAERVAPELNYGADEKRRGAIFTKIAVVDFMLDLIGYTSNKRLQDKKLLEPSFGGGRFLLRASDRLLAAWRKDGGGDPRLLKDCIRAVELDLGTYRSVSDDLLAHLVEHGVESEDASFLVGQWLVQGDFLFAPLGLKFDFIIGNPPYVRQELIEPDLLNAYRSAFSAMVGRADLYVAFMERSLDLLNSTGRLSFICADAWVKNEYGRGIRSKIANGFNFSHYVDMYGLDSFEVEVGAYPSITVLERSNQELTRLVHADNVDREYLQDLAVALNGPLDESSKVREADVVREALPWLVGDAKKSGVIHHLEGNFPTLLEAGCRVGIGVATGADRVFIAPVGDIDVEESRKLPLATNKCTSGGEVEWTGKEIVNPWADQGGLVDLAEYPKLAAYFELHKEQLSKRHTAKSNVARNWYKTIDRITPGLVEQPKLLIPDIKGNGDAITYDPGTLYPHHNLYFITSTTWDLRALQALLRSGIALLFVEAYSVKIGGGYLRFQAQNLKRIRIPEWESLSPKEQSVLTLTGKSDEKLSNRFVERIYKLEEGTLSFLNEETE